MDVFRIGVVEDAGSLRCNSQARGDLAKARGANVVGQNQGRDEGRGFGRGTGRSRCSALLAMLGRNGAAGGPKFAGQGEEVGDTGWRAAPVPLQNGRFPPLLSMVPRSRASSGCGISEGQFPRGATKIGENTASNLGCVAVQIVAHGIANVAEVPWPGRPGFPFAAPGQSAAGRFGRFYGEEPVPAPIAKTQRHLAPAQVEPGVS